MRKFSIDYLPPRDYCDKFSFRIMIERNDNNRINDIYKFMQSNFIHESYNIETNKLSDIYKKYNAFFSNSQYSSIVYFHFHHDAQLFIDEILIPYEIAYNINEAIRR